MMQFTRYGQERIAETVRSAPVGPLEFRRVKGLGPLYIALAQARPHPQFRAFMVLRIDGADYRLCWKDTSRIPDAAPATGFVLESGRKGSEQTAALALVKQT